MERSTEEEADGDRAPEGNQTSLSNSIVAYHFVEKFEIHANF